MSLKKYSTVKNWGIATGYLYPGEKEVRDDIHIWLKDGDILSTYDIPMEEAMEQLAKAKRLFRTYPNGDFFQVSFGGTQHGFTRACCESFIGDLKNVISECMARRVMETSVFSTEQYERGILNPAAFTSAAGSEDIVPRNIEEMKVTVMDADIPEGIEKE